MMLFGIRFVYFVLLFHFFFMDGEEDASNGLPLSPPPPPPPSQLSLPYHPTANPSFLILILEERGGVFFRFSPKRVAFDTFLQRSS